MQIIDVSDPTNPQRLGGYDTSASGDVTHLFDITVLANLRSQGFRQSVRIGIANGFQIATLWS
jgi:hypothetical protein